MKKRIVVVGSSNTDMIVKTSRLPQAGETVIGGKFFMAPGGKGANQAVAAARAGGNVAFIARVGEDMFGRKAIEGFRRDQINVDYVFKDKEAPSGIALIFVSETGENSIAVASGANARLSPQDLEKAKKTITQADVLLIQLEVPLETVRAAVEIASAAGVRIILNPAPAQKLDDKLLKKISILSPNETEAELLSGINIRGKSGVSEAARILLSRGMEAVLVTLGSKGIYVATKESSRTAPAFKVKAVDTTAAGDVFNGALAVALSEKKTIFESAVFANAAAAISVTKIGAQPSAPHRKEIESFLRSHSHQKMKHFS